MIDSSSRRSFLKAASVLLASAFTGFPYQQGASAPRLSFSTIGCPDWDFTTIVHFAARHGYSGIELRGIQRELELPNAAAFKTRAALAASMALMKEKGVAFAGLGSSANLHFKKGPEREKNMAEARRFIDLAQQLNCPYVRVFPNKFPKDQEKAETMELIASGLLQLAGHAKGTGVTVLLETHGEVVRAADLAQIMQVAAHPNVGLIWDISNMWTVTRESPAEVYPQLKKYIRHCHIKDASTTGDQLQYRLLGKGDVPVFDAIDILHKDGFEGYYSFEWEKLWHPEIEAPETALADYPNVMKQHFLNL